LIVATVKLNDDCSQLLHIESDYVLLIGL